MMSCLMTVLLNDGVPIVIIKWGLPLYCFSVLNCFSSIYLDYCSCKVRYIYFFLSWESDSSRKDMRARGVQKSAVLGKLIYYIEPSNSQTSDRRYMIEEDTYMGVWLWVWKGFIFICNLLGHFTLNPVKTLFILSMQSSQRGKGQIETLKNNCHKGLSDVPIRCLADRDAPTALELSFLWGLQ